MSRGEVNWVVLTAIIAIVLLFIIFVAAKGGFDPITNYVKNLPGFKQDTQQVAPLGVVRYDVVQDKVESYDGSQWNPVSKSIDIKDSGTVTGAQLQSALSSYYFSKDLRGDREVYADNQYDASIVSISTSDSLKATADHFWEKPGAAFANWWTERSHPPYTRGALIIGVTKNTDFYGFVIISPDKTISFDGDAFKQDNPFVAEAPRTVLSDTSIKWRDSVFKKPVVIGGKPFCRINSGGSFDGRYIVFDLTNSQEKCNA